VAKQRILRAAVDSGDFGLMAIPGAVTSGRKFSGKKSRANWQYGWPTAAIRSERCDPPGVPACQVIWNNRPALYFRRMMALGEKY